MVSFVLLYNLVIGRIRNCQILKGVYEVAFM